MTRNDPIPASIGALFEGGAVAGLADGRLLGRFVARGDEVAFAALVDRHGPMVLRACRSALGDGPDAEDAFQATFLILARKAGSIRDRDSAASWLHGVARRVAGCSQRASARRRARERSAAGMVAEAVPDRPRDDLAAVLDEEVGGLPEKYREPLTLCLRDGLTHEEAARRLGWPVGTVKTRVRWARDRLQTRLARRGLAPSLAAIGAAWRSAEAATVPAALAHATARAAIGAGRAMAPGALSASVSVLVGLGIRSMLMDRLKVVAVAFVSFGVLAAGATGLARQGPGNQEKGKGAEVRPAAKEEAPPAPPGPKLAEIEAAQEERLDRIEEVKLDIELLRMEVDQLKQRANICRDAIVRAENGLQDLTSPTLQDFPGEGVTGELRREGADPEVLKVQYRAYIKDAKKRLREANAEYLARARDLRREGRRLADLQSGAAARPEAAASGPPAQPPAEAIERRLSDVEKKLDRILKSVEARGRVPGR